jgi:GxxExxY protein
MDQIIIECAAAVYAELGTGHSEIVYHKAMEVELRSRSIRYESKVVLPIYYRFLTVGYSEADLIVYESEQDVSGIVVELKAVTYAPREAERAQLRSYLRARHIPDAEGLLINFRQPTATTPSPETPDVSLIGIIEHRIAPPHPEKESESNDNE